MGSKSKVLIYCLLAVCACGILLTVVDYLIPRYNSPNKDLWYEKDIDALALDYYKDIHTENCEPQVIRRSYSYTDESGTKYPFSSVDVTIQCDHGEYLISVDNDSDTLKAVCHSFGKPSAPLWFMLILQIIIVAVVACIIFVVKYLKKKQIRLL